MVVEVGAGVHRRLAELAAGEPGESCSWCCRPAFAALLSRLGAGTDIAVGTPVAGRTDEALDDLVGMFVNTLVLRTDVSGVRRLPSWWGECGRRTWLRYAHQDVPFERLVDVLAPARSQARNPLFQVRWSCRTPLRPPGRCRWICRG